MILYHKWLCFVFCFSFDKIRGLPNDCVCIYNQVKILCEIDILHAMEDDLEGVGMLNKPKCLRHSKLAHTKYIVFQHPTPWFPGLEHCLKLWRAHRL